MNIKNYLSPTKKYKFLISSIHSIYRLVNSTFELKDLIVRFCRLISQIFNANYCLIIILDHSKKCSILKAMVSDRKKYIIDGREAVSNGLEKKIIRTSRSIRRDRLLALPLICDDIIGIIIL